MTIINTVIESTLGMVKGGDGVAVELELAERVCIDAVEPPRSSIHNTPYFGHAVKSSKRAATFVCYFTFDYYTLKGEMVVVLFVWTEFWNSLYNFVNF